MTPEFNPIDPALERAVSEIRNDAVDPALVEAAAARVWANLVAQAPELHEAHPHLRTCADFQALIPDFRAGRLPDARVTLVRDHLHECVACRKVYEGKVVTMPAPVSRRILHPVRWAAAAVVVVAAGMSIWIAVDQYGGHTGRAIVQSVNGALYEVSAAGIRPLAAGQDLPDGIELRTAKDSGAMLQLRDGSVIELRERSGLSTTQTASDLTIHLVRGSVIVQAARRRSGHLYVATPDCRVAVTGTVFSVSAGVKGSRVSVIQGEVHVTQDNSEVILHPGDQKVTSAALEPVSVSDDIQWSRDRERLTAQLASLHASLQELHLPALRYSSRLLPRLPATTVFFASIPNLAQYLGDAQSVFQQKMAESPELRAWWASRGANIQPVIEKLRAASEYLGDEIVIAGFTGAGGEMHGPVLLAETRRDGFPELLEKEIPQVAIETRPGLVAFGPDREAVAQVAQSLDGPGFQGTPFYAAIEQSYREGAGLLLCADLSRLNNRPLPGARYFMAGQKEVNGQMETRASLGFDGPRTGIAAWLAAPSPMGSLDYVSPEATFVTAFVVKNPAAIVDEVLGVEQRSEAAAQKALDEFHQESGIDIRNDLAASLGGEFAVAMDGPVIPVPSWKLVTEVYDPSRMQNTLQKAVDAYNQNAVKTGGKPLRTSQETVEGRTYYMIGGADANPLTEAHYVFSDGYMIAAPSRALVTRALQVRAAGTSITHSAQFLAMTPRDHYTNFSAVVFQNMGTTLAPLAGLLGAFAPPNQSNHPNPLQNLGNMKPVMFAVYGEPDRITLSGSAGGLGGSLTGLLTGNLTGVVGSALPFGQMMGTRRPQPAFQYR
ncbi:MAG TPA: FecR domain-containing protein [Bryobacteraceae bacterium]|nr:FecR domain-containing protein [Bryobacteraceae bacterium]